MSVGSGQTRATDLLVRVYRQSIHPDWFRVFRHARLGNAAWDCDLRVIEGGHVLHWMLGPVRITEVLAGPEQLLPEAGLLHRSSIKHDRDICCQVDDLIDYRTCIGVEHVDREVFEHLSEELRANGPKTTLFHRVPGGNRMAPESMSCLHAERVSRGVSVHAFHTFPTELAIVRVQSLIEISDRFVG